MLFAKTFLMKLVLSYVLTSLVFFAIDLTWLGLVAKKFYWEQLGGLLKENVNWAAAITFYLIYIVGIFIFSILPAVENDSVKHAVFYGALFGFFAYATYDLTNLATLKDWPLKVVLVDIVWGIVLTGAVSTAGFYITRWLH
jgi:uncharacterized membrane protein